MTARGPRLKTREQLTGRFFLEKNIFLCLLRIMFLTLLFVVIMWKILVTYIKEILDRKRKILPTFIQTKHLPFNFIIKEGGNCG